MKRLIYLFAIIAYFIPTSIQAEEGNGASHVAPAVATAEVPAGGTVDEAAIRKAVAAYVDAFNKGDSKALTAMWAPGAVYINPMNGDRVVGREAIEKQFAGVFAESKGSKLEAVSDSIQFVSPSVAVEHGTAKLIQTDGSIDESQYTAIYVQRDSSWLLDRVTEEDVVEQISHYDQLKDLEWMVGSWIDQDEQSTVTTECNWSKNNNFLVRSFAVQVRDQIDVSGMQLIGWDPSTKQIRSWVFDSDGGFGQGTWAKKGNSWFVQQSGVLPDGRKTTAVNVFKRLDDSNFTLKSVNRTVDGDLLPNIEEVKITKE